MTAQETAQLIELSSILEQLYICTNVLQADGVTISRVLPSLVTVLHNLDIDERHKEAAKKVINTIYHTYNHTHQATHALFSINARSFYSFTN